MNRRIRETQAAGEMRRGYFFDRLGFSEKLCVEVGDYKFFDYTVLKLVSILLGREPKPLRSGSGKDNDRKLGLFCRFGCLDEGFDRFDSVGEPG